MSRFANQRSRSLTSSVFGPALLLACWVWPGRPTAAAENEIGDAARPSPTRSVSDQPQQLPRKSDGDGRVVVHGETKTWHKITLDLSGPYAHEQDNAPNPFTDCAFETTFRHRDGTEYRVPGYFAADGDAADSAAQSGTV